MLKIGFKYKDEFDNSTEQNVEIPEESLEIMTHLEVLVEQFQLFLLGAGFPKPSVDEYFKK